ncbi:hypothetical protein BT93_G1011 [Corymbia citriodora subsp. variegata]|nr:hypothetical protein BT93_G1011 [Corymbia citriodora subsp. variegata]
MHARDYIYPSTHTLALPHTHTDDSKNALPFINIIIFYYNHSLLALGYGLPLPSRSLWPCSWPCGGKQTSTCWRTLEHTGTGTGRALIKKHGGCSRSRQVKNFSSLMIMIYM